jgi:GntR family transcriptional regulator of arabinose operon
MMNPYQTGKDSLLRIYRYEEIARDLRARIEDGTYTETQKLPSERNLMQHYQVQRDTIRRALALLEAEGCITTHQKRGSFIVPVVRITPDITVTGAAIPVGTPPRERVSGSILVITPRNDFSTALESLLRGLSAVLEPTGNTLRYFDSQPLPGRVTQELPTREFLAENNIVGVAVWPHSTADAVELDRLRALVPLVLIDRRIPGFASDVVAFDNVAGGQKVTEHLIHLGHERIGFLGDEVFAESVQHRWRGYATALENAGIGTNSADYLFFNGVDDDVFATHVVPFLRGSGPRPLTAVVCSNDGTALRLLRFLRTLGQDLAVTGYGDLLPHYLGAMGLTTVSQPFEEVGRTVGRVLLSRLSEPPLRTNVFQQIDIPVHLIVRGSTVPLPATVPVPVLEPSADSSAGTDPSAPNLSSTVRNLVVS